MRFVRLGLAFVLLAAPLTSQAWWNEDWNFRKEIAFDLTPTGADVAGTPTDVPVLIRLHIGNFTYFTDTLPDGADLRFIAADDKTPLKFHIERYDPQSQMAFLWVLVPRLAGGSNTDKIFLYYGNKEAASASDPAATYGTTQAAVYHFAEATGQAPQDSTAYKNNPATPGVETYATSLIGGGLRLSGSNSLQIPASQSLRVLPQQGATISAWVRFDTPPTDAYVAALEDSGRSLILGVNGLGAFARLTGTAGRVDLPQAAGELTAGAWHHLAVRAGDGRLTLFVDGVDAGGVDVEVPEIGGTLTVGGAAAGSNYFSGELDELEFATAVRSAD